MRETNMTLPDVTICSKSEYTYDMILDCWEPSGNDCEMNILTLYNRENYVKHCVQLNRKNVTVKIGDTYLGYQIYLYTHNDARLVLAVTDNSARVVEEEVEEDIFPGQDTQYVLSKTVQIALGPPYSNCNQSSDYRQVNCIKDCDKKAIIEACGCGYEKKCPSKDVSKLSKICQNERSNPDLILAKCNKECLVECNQVSFQSKRVDIERNGKSFINIWKQKVSERFDIFENSFDEFNEDEFKKKITQLWIKFDKFETTEITQSPRISLTSLIANVGGLLGKSLHSRFIFTIHQLIHLPF